MKSFPEGFPIDLQDELIKLGSREQALPVYRICKWGIVERKAFISTYEETINGYRPKPKNFQSQLKDPSTYSTSCNQKHEELEQTLGLMMRHHPKAVIAKGVTHGSCGLSILTREYKPERKDDHVDWWVYENSSPQDYFCAEEENNEN